MVRTKNNPKKDEKQRHYKRCDIGGRTFKVLSTTFKRIRQLQLTTEMLIPKQPFSRLIREILQTVYLEHRDMRIQMAALSALQEAAEIYMTSLFEDANMCAAHARRITLRPDDMKLALALRGAHDVFNH